MNLKPIAVLASVLALSGCSWFSDDEKGIEEDYVYTQSRYAKALEVPEGLVVEEDDFAYIPNVDVNKKGLLGAQIDIRTPTLILAVGKNLRVNSEAGTPSVWMTGKKEAVIERFEKFLQLNKINFKRQQDLIITGWRQQVDDSFFGGKVLPKEVKAERNRFSIHFYPSKLPNEVGVQVVHTEALGIRRDGDDNWQKMPLREQTAAEFLNAFIIYDYEQSVLRSKEAIAKAKPIVIRLAKNQEDQFVFLADADFSKTWNRFLRIAERAGFEIDTSDATLGLISAEYDNPELNVLSTVAVEQTQSGIDEGEYSLQFSEVGNRTAIQLFDEEGRQLTQEQLTKLYYILEPLFAE